MQPTEFTFSRPERKSDGTGYISFCSLGGAVSDPTKKGVEMQVSYWLKREKDWKQWVANIR